MASKQAQPVRFKLLLAYHGAAFHGWYPQQSGHGVHNHLERAFIELVPTLRDAPYELQGASRTDAGVHAWGQVAHIEMPAADAKRMASSALAHALNAKLVPAVRVRAVSRVSRSFHARFSAQSKTYRYALWNHPVAHPLFGDRAWHVPQALCHTRMQEAASILVGTHNFCAFTSRRCGELGDPCRTLRSLRMSRQGPLMHIELQASGFLYRMARHLVGTIVLVGQGALEVKEIQAMLTWPYTHPRPLCAPAHGLTLMRVSY